LRGGCNEQVGLPHGFLNAAARYLEIVGVDLYPDASAA
jgi:hypothetical protein